MGRDSRISKSPQQSPRFFRHGSLYLCAEQRYTRQRTDPDGDTDQEIEKVSPCGTRLPPGHLDQEPCHEPSWKRDVVEDNWPDFLESVIKPSLNDESKGMLSDSKRPSRSDSTRCIEEANVVSWVTSTSVVP